VNNLENIFSRIYASLKKRSFIFIKKIRAKLLQRKKLNIVLSKKFAWEEDLRNGFKYLPHQLTFAELSSVDLAKYDVVIPLNIEDVLYLNSVRNIIDTKTLPIPNKDVVHLCDDKYLFSQHLIEHGFEDYIPKINSSEKNYPFFLKKKKDTWSQNIHLISNFDQEQKLLKTINKDDYYRQEAIYGNYEYATHILYDDNKIIHSLTIKHNYTKHHHLPILGRDKHYQLITKSNHLTLFASILEKIGYKGLCCIDYKIINNVPKIFEINPRLGGSATPFLFIFMENYSNRNSI